MKNIVLADCSEKEMELFMEGINSSQAEFELKVKISNFSQKSKMNNLRRYFAYFAMPFGIFLKRRNYNMIIGWQQFYALVFCFWCAVFKVKKRNKVIAVNFTYREKKGRFSRIYRWFMAKCLSGGYLDYIHVPSHNYAQNISREFGFDSKKILITPFGIDDEYERYKNSLPPKEVGNDGYFLAIGRSNRDYEFLLDVWKNIDYKLVIVSDIFNGEVKNQDVIVKNNITADTQHPWIIHCKAVIIPIDNPEICSGDTVMLQGMSFKQIVIVTAPSTLAEMYIDDKVNGLAVEKNIDKFRQAVNDVIDGKYESIRDNARESFLSGFSRKSMAEQIIMQVGDSECWK